MKHYLAGLCTTVIIGCSLAGCDEDHVTYDGPNYVMFSDTLSTIAIQNKTTMMYIYQLPKHVVTTAPTE